MSSTVLGETAQAAVLLNSYIFISTWLISVLQQRNQCRHGQKPPRGISETKLVKNLVVKMSLRAINCCLMLDCCLKPVHCLISAANELRSSWTSRELMTQMY